MQIKFFHINHDITLRKRGQLKSFLGLLFKEEGIKIQTLNYIFCSDNYLLNINKLYLKHQFLTDIITFNLAEKLKPIEGEIYISNPRVRENAQKLKVSINSEIHRVIFHGALHLCGYEDKSIKESLNMRKREDFYLKLYFGKTFHV